MKRVSSPIKNLAAAIVIQAVKDYRSALHYLRRHPHTPDLDTKEAKEDEQKRKLRNKIVEKENARDEIEQFFCSGWFMELTDLNGKALMEKIRRMEVAGSDA